MRIVGGKYRGKKLIGPENMAVRPTSDRAREAIFNILYSAIGGVQDKKVLDVFAGTGALGFEALSRGAQSVCFIDKETKSVLKNMALFDADKDKIKVIRSDVNGLKIRADAFDLIFSDAPYDKGLNEKAFEALVQNELILDGAMCVVETRHNEVLNLLSNFELINTRIYGMAKIWFYVFHL